MKIQVLVAALAGVGVMASTNAGVVGVGDSVTGSNWRTNALFEVDNEYGTDGYLIYGMNQADGTWNPAPYDASTSNPDQMTSLPHYINDVVIGDGLVTGMWAGNGNFGQIEDPENGNALVSTPLLAHGTLQSDPANVITISRSMDSAYRLSIIVSSGDGLAKTYTAHVDDGSGSSAQAVTVDSAGIGYLVFDVAAGTSDVTVNIEPSDPTGFGITGFTFDNGVPVPEPGSLALLGLGGLMIARRRRG